MVLYESAVFLYELLITFIYAPLDFCLRVEELRQ